MPLSKLDSAQNDLSFEKVPELSHSALDILGFSESDLREMLLIIMKMKYEPIIL